MEKTASLVSCRGLESEPHTFKNCAYKIMSYYKLPIVQWRLLSDTQWQNSFMSRFFKFHFTERQCFNNTKDKLPAQNIDLKKSNRITASPHYWQLWYTLTQVYNNLLFNLFTSIAQTQPKCALHSIFKRKLYKSIK